MAAVHHHANSQNSASNGVLATSASIGVAANSAAQNVVNVSANITIRKSDLTTPGGPGPPGLFSGETTCTSGFG